MSIFSLFGGILLQGVGTLLIFIGLILLIQFLLRRKMRLLFLTIIFVLIGISLITFSGRTYLGLLVLQPMPDTFGTGAHGPFPHPDNVAKFFLKLSDFEKIGDIAEDATSIPLPLNYKDSRFIKYELEAKEVLSEVAPGIVFNYWTFNGKVPGPFLRIVEGDTVEITLKNHPSSLHIHSIDFHAVTGPGGGAAVTQVEPGKQKTFQFKALNAGLYVYHCATPDPAAHSAHGQYGLILVEPKGGLPKVDKEFYLMQGEIYTFGNLGDKGLQLFDGNAMLDGHPQYIIFNGRVGGASNLKAKTGEKIRMFVGNGGVSLSSSFHVIGEIFDRVYPEGAIASPSAYLRNIQTTNVPAGGASMVEFNLEVPGKYVLVDHALSRVDRGAVGILEVEGPEQPEIFRKID
jgi:nitrite reductase (NO-forming)